TILLQGGQPSTQICWIFCALLLDALKLLDERPRWKLALWCYELGIDRTKLRVLTHYNGIACQCPHGCSGHGSEGHKHTNIGKLAPQVADNTRSCFCASARTVEYDIQFRTTQTVANLHHALH